ncbi:MAG: sigma-70 family RNA polymerase sigma factor [Bacteroidetes bacterium]|nr:sigma-70 family RNA polymerase sigma factor [Bacteroidota bacterium]
MNGSIANNLNPQNWVNNYADYLYKVAFYRVNKVEVAEDLVQDTFLSALKAKDTFNGTASEKTWLTAILKNKIIDYFKKASTKNELLLNESQGNEVELDYFFNYNKMGKWEEAKQPKQWTEAHCSTEKNEFYKILNQCLSKISIKWQGIFKMCLIDEEDAKLVCKEFDISSSNLWVILHRSKLQIRECLEKNWLKL